MRIVVVACVLALALLVAAVFGLKAYRDARDSLSAEMPIDAPTVFKVERGATMRSVANEMHGNGWLANPAFYAWHAGRLGKASQIKAGTYQLTPGMSALDALEVFVAGREIQHAFTVVEGWNVRDLLAALAKSPHLEQTVAGRSGEQIMQQLGRPDLHPEGMFHADTYKFPPGTTDLELLTRALETREARLAELWAERAENLPLTSPYEALILASIVEKETAVADERPRIAGVFVTRLRRKMRLETDPTVIYGIGETFDGNLRRRDLKTDTPYNTYTRSGLPPTPIAMVGDDALRAALNPEVDGMLFFVARGDGRHHFSRSYNEHLKAVRRYQIERRRPKAKSN